MWLKFEKKILKIVRVTVRAILKKRGFEKNAFKVLSRSVHSADSRMRDARHASGKTGN